MNTTKIKHNVLFDTQVIIQNNYQYQNGKISLLTELIQQCKIDIYITPITIGEIKSHIESDVKDAEKAFNTFRQNGSILYNCQSSYKCLSEKFNLSIITKELISQFEKFLEDCEAKVLPINMASADKVFKKYFSKDPPFGEGKKKDEFPDAFAIAVLESWCAENNQTMYVISGDNDWKMACIDHEHLIWLEKLENLYQLIEFEDKYISDNSETFFESHLSAIKEKVRTQFVNLGFYLDNTNFSRITDDEDVDNIEMNTIDLSEKFLVKVDHKNCSLLFSCKFLCKFLADIHYVDYTDATYDKEDDVYLFGESTAITVETSYLIDVDVVIKFSKEDPSDSKLTDVVIQEEDIPIILEDDERYPYK